MKKYKGLKDFAEKNGVKTIQIIENTITNSDICPVKLPVFVIDKDKNMKVFCER